MLGRLPIKEAVSRQQAQTPQPGPLGLRYTSSRYEQDHLVASIHSLDPISWRHLDLELCSPHLSLVPNDSSCEDAEINAGRDLGRWEGPTDDREGT